MPALDEHFTPKDVGELLVSYAKRMQDPETRTLLIAAIVDDPKKTDHTKLKELVEYACCEFNAFKLVQDLYDDATIAPLQPIYRG